MIFDNVYDYENAQQEHRNLSENLDIYLESLLMKHPMEFIRLYNECMFIDEDYDSLITEGKVRGVVDKVKTINKRTDQKIDGTFEPIIKKIKTSIIGQTRDEIINNHVKVSKLIKRCLFTGGLFLINPTIGILKLFITKILRENLKTKERERILADLKRELAICEEKIKDADSSGDRKKKYELMRLKNELERSIERVRKPSLTNA